MKSNYKKLGQYIQQVSIKNTDLKIDNLLGVSITKEFIPSIANTIGTDMSKYKIVKKGRYICRYWISNRYHDLYIFAFV